jgi:ABC-2 type transport system ATP-binding protein
MDDVKELCKRVIVIDHGKIIYDGNLDKLVRRFATYKKITVVFDEYVDPKKLSELGEIKEFTFPRLVLNLDREKTNQVAANLLKEFPVADINIEEPEIEDIIRKVFKGRELA